MQHARLGILVQQSLQSSAVAVELGARQRRREVIDDNRSPASFRLRPFAGVAHDEGIEVWHLRQHRLAGARVRQGDRLAGQPFGSAVLADMHQGVAVPYTAQPPVLRQVRVRWRQVGIVRDRIGVALVAARGLQRNRDVAQQQGRQREKLLCSLVRALGDIGGIDMAHEGIVARLPPDTPCRLLQRGRHFLEKTFVVGKKESRKALSSAGLCVRRSCLESCEQSFCRQVVVRNFSQAIALALQGAKDRL